MRANLDNDLLLFRENLFQRALGREFFFPFSVFFTIVFVLSKPHSYAVVQAAENRGKISGDTPKIELDRR